MEIRFGINYVPKEDKDDFLSLFHSPNENDRIIADGNTFASSYIADNYAENGDTIHDVEERVEFGANEKLLPQTDKDQFVGIPRRPFVNDSELGKLSVTEYIREKSASENIVILAPGAYTA